MEDQIMQETTGVEEVPAAEVQDTGVESQAAAEPDKQNNFEKAFAKRLAEKEAQWRAEKDAELSKFKEQYKDYDDLKSVADYFRELNQAPDIMSLKERIEMERLQERAEQQGISPELQRRLEELETKAAKAEELERQQQEEQRRSQEEAERQKAFTEFRSKLDEFAKGKGADADKLYEYMVENQIGNMDAAYKAMRHDELEAKIAEAEKAGMKKFLTAKGSIPTIPSNNQSAQKVQSTPKTFAEARERAMAREL